MTKPDTTQVPDALGDTGRAEMLAKQLNHLQQQRFNLDMAQIANNHKDTDIAPLGEGPQVTYAKRRKMLTDSEKRLLAGFPELIEKIKEALAPAEPDEES